MNLVQITPSKPEDIVVFLKKNGFYPSAEESSLAHKLYSGGAHAEDILDALSTRRAAKSSNSPEPQVTQAKLHSICRLQKQELLSEAFSKGIVDYDELVELASVYDLICYGKTKGDAVSSQTKCTE